jgi:hypothetical protein
MRKILFILSLMSFVLLSVTVPDVIAECKGDLNCDGALGGSDLAEFAEDFGSTDCPACTPAPVARTGQILRFARGDDGDLEMGVAWPDPRFTDNGNGTVTDNLTGLIWLKNANCFGQKIWTEALVSCNSLADGQCGLSDGSGIGNWHLPNIKQLHSLIDFGMSSPALPSGHPFTAVTSFYWSSTTNETYTYGAWYIYIGTGSPDWYDKDLTTRYVWPVRAGN